MSDEKIKTTRLGFVYGPATVVRSCDIERYGAWIIVQGKRQQVVVRVTPGGYVRIGKPEKAVDYGDGSRRP